MITQSEVNRQLMRLDCLPYRPKDDDAAVSAIQELRRIMARDCSSDVHVKAVVDTMMETCRSWPAPSELIDAIRNTPDPYKPQGCSRCGGTGWYHFTRLTRTPAGAYEADFSVPCNCDKGACKAAGADDRPRQQTGELSRVNS
jgi:hypothetical protein